MTPTTPATSTTEAGRNTPVFDLSGALREVSPSRSPAAITEDLMPEIKESFWLLVSSNAVINGQENQALRMIFERALPSGVSVAFDLDWQPQHWGLPPASPPSAEVLRRIRPLVEGAQLIRCTSAEADTLFGSRDPVRIHDMLPQRPAVLISSPAGGLDWCIGGRSGRLDPEMLQDHEVFLARLMDNLCTNPQLLGSAGPGIDAVADPDGLAEQLLSAAAASVSPEPVQD